MKVLIDKGRMTFLRKMENEATLSKLADLECPHLSVAIYYADEPRDFVLFTDLELKLLIKNSAGPDVRNVFSREPLMQIVFELTKALPESKANAFEVDLQLRSIKEGDTGRYLYVPGSQKPKPADGLEELAALQCTADAAGRAATLAKQAPQGVVAAATASAANALPAVQPSDDFTPPRVGTSTHTIFTFCANAWKEANYADTKNVLDGIKKTAVDKLVPTGLNISTVRTQAARWYQHRQRFVI